MNWVKIVVFVLRKQDTMDVMQMIEAVWERARKQYYVEKDERILEARKKMQAKEINIAGFEKLVVKATRDLRTVKA